MNGITLLDGVSLSAEIEGLQLLTFSPVDNDTLAVLYSNAKFAGTFVDKHWVWTDDPSGQARIALYDGSGGRRMLPPFETPSAGMRFAMLPDGGWVIAQSQRNRLEPGDCDATIFDSGGRMPSSFNAGGANGFVQTTAMGGIWIGHEDDDPARESKLGGLSFFDRTGQAGPYIWFPGFEGSPNYGMAFWCCYALNVVGETAWTQFYTDMLISRTEPDGSQDNWLCWNKGAAALIVKNSIVVLAGRYDTTQYEMHAYHLGQSPTAEHLGTVRFTIKGQQPKYIDWIEGRGDTFHIVHDKSWYRISMSDVLSKIGAPQ